MELKFNPQGLIPAIVQDASNQQVLMMAWMNDEALEHTLRSGHAYFWSRSRGELWHKGSTSGNIMLVQRIVVDCDADTLLLQVTSAGPACHTGQRTCFFTLLNGGEHAS